MRVVLRQAFDFLERFPRDKHNPKIYHTTIENESNVKALLSNLAKFLHCISSISKLISPKLFGKTGSFKSPLTLSRNLIERPASLESSLTRAVAFGGLDRLDLQSYFLESQRTVMVFTPPLAPGKSRAKTLRDMALKLFALAVGATAQGYLFQVLSAEQINFATLHDFNSSKCARFFFVSATRGNIRTIGTSRPASPLVPPSFNGDI